MLGYCHDAPLGLILAAPFPFEVFHDPQNRAASPFCNAFLLLYSALVSARDAQIFPVLRDRATSDLDALRLQDTGDLLVGERPGRIFFLNELFDAAFEDEQRRVAALRTVHAFAEEVPQFKYALGSVGILAGHGAADGGRMHADFLGHLLDHHWF